MLKRRTNASPASPGEPCSLTRCMRLISGAWAPNVVWKLRGGPRRFSELEANIPLVSAKVLSTRLRELETKGVVRRRICDTSPPSVEYSLTPMGEKLVPALDALVAVGRELQQQGYPI